MPAGGIACGVKTVPGKNYILLFHFVLNEPFWLCELFLKHKKWNCHTRKQRNNRVSHQVEQIIRVYYLNNSYNYYYYCRRALSHSWILWLWERTWIVWLSKSFWCWSIQLDFWKQTVLFISENRSHHIWYGWRRYGTMFVVCRLYWAKVLLIYGNDVLDMLCTQWIL